MTRSILRKRKYYTTFKNLKVGDRFKFHPSGTGPFVKYARKRYESSAAGDDVAQTYTNVTVKKLWPQPIESN